MIKLTLSYSNNQEKEKIIADISKLEEYKILNISKEYSGKGKSLYKRTYIDLSEK